MKKLLSDLKIKEKDENLISLTLFGSFNTKEWYENKSDIDILVLVKKSGIDVEIEIENKYRKLLVEYFNYDNIHFTFIATNNFDTVFADIYIDYEDKIIFNVDLHYDFLMYINKFNRINESLIKLVREDWESKYGVL